MIIELFGPPGAGKTTFAHALERQLREAGYFVETVFSNRPAERNAAPLARRSRNGISALFRRLTRPIAEIATVMYDPADRDRAAMKLMELNPPAKVVWRIRLYQYLIRLSRSWARASKADHVVLFDQGYVQLVCSLIQLGSKEADEELLEKLLDAMPRSALLINLEAPRAILEQRLRERFQSQHPMERLLELDLKTNLDSVEVIAKLAEMLRKRGLHVVSVSSLDPASLFDGLATIQEKLDELSRSCRKADQQSALG